MRRTSREVLRGAAAAGLTGAAAGALCGGVEMAAIALGKGAGTIPWSDVLLPMLMSALFWGPIAGGLALAHGIVRGRRTGTLPARSVRHVEGTVGVGAGAAFVWLLAQLNIHWVARPMAAKNLLLDVGLLVGIVAAAWLLRIAALRALERVRWLGRGTKVAGGVLGAGLLVFALIPAAGSGPVLRDAAHADRPDVIVMVVDTLRADHLGVYGYGRATSDALDRLAADGVTFSRCIAQSSTTPPSTASLLTGLYPPTHNHRQLLSVLPPGVMMMPDAMRIYGYRTAFLSTNPLISRSYGFARGAERYRGTPGRGPYLVSLFHVVNLGRKFETRVLGAGPWLPATLFERLYKALNRVLYGRPPIPDDAGWLHGELLAWLDEDDPRPSFAYLHSMEPHQPYQPDPPFADLFQQPGYDGPAIYDPPKAVNAFPPLMQGPALPPDQLHHIVANYDGEIADFDHQLGLLVQELKRRGRYDSTLIVVTADHGEEFHDHGAWAHGHSLYQELIHVPLIVKLPGNRHAGLILEGQVRGVDVLPTILDLVDAEPWGGIQGESLAEVIEREDTARPGRDAYSEIQSRGYHGQSFISGNHKLVQVELGEEHWYLYDLDTDPGETTSLLESAPHQFATLRSEMEAAVQTYSGAPLRSTTGALSEEMKEQLRALGYLD